MAADLRLLLDATPHLRSCLATPADIEELADMAMPSTAVLEELHLELLLTHALDFRDALCLAATCTAAHRALQRGPLHLITDITRSITVTQLSSLLHALRWCGTAVHTLRLDQQPRVLWAPGIGGDERGRIWSEKMSFMPHPSSEMLRTIRVCCPNVQTLGLKDWVAYRNADPLWSASLASELAQMSKLRRVRMPSEAFLNNVDRPCSTLADLLDACPDLEQLHVEIPPAQIRRVCERPLAAARILQLYLRNAAAQEVALLFNCSSLRRLHLLECSVDGLDLTLALPPNLSVLTITGSEGVAATPPAERTRSHWTKLRWLNVDYSPTAVLTNSCLLETVSHVPNLLVLELNSSDSFTDEMLRIVVEHCTRLHTLRIAYAEVTDAGLSTLLDREALPCLRCLLYWNSSYEKDLVDFFTMDILELHMSREEDLDEMANFDWDGSGYMQPELRHILAWYAYVAVVVTRQLVTPVTGGPFDDLLPWQEHPLCQDYFRLD